VAEAEGTVYVYGVLAASDRGSVSVKGVAGSGVRTVEDSGLAALVSDLEGGALMAAREVRAHWRVLEEASQGATVLPIRFGTVMESEDAVRERLLERNSERLADLLRALAGRVQLSVKGAYDEARVLREVVQGTPAVAALRKRVRALPDEAGYYDRIRLGELVAAEVARRRDADARLALDRLQPLAEAARAEQPGGSDAAFHLAFLVACDSVEAFSAAVRGLAEEMGERIHIRYVGPLPPYSFAEGDLTAGSAAWA
jgi:hypothetical protein